MPFSSSIKEIEAFKSDAIFVVWTEVPYWVQGVKVQIFHGLAGEEKGILELETILIYTSHKENILQRTLKHLP